MFTEFKYSTMKKDKMGEFGAETQEIDNWYRTAYIQKL